MAGGLFALRLGNRYFVKPGIAASERRVGRADQALMN